MIALEVYMYDNLTMYQCVVADYPSESIGLLGNERESTDKHL